MKIQVSDKLKAIALSGITAFVDGFKKQSRAFENLSANVLNIAKEAAVESGDDLKAAADLFDAAAKQAQREYQKTHKDGDKVVPMELLCPAWAPRKSEVLRCMRKGVDPRDYEKVVDMTRARVALVAEERGAQERKEGKADSNDATTLEVSEGISAAVSRLYKAIGAASSVAKFEAAIIAKLDETSAELEALYLSSGESDGETEEERDEAAAA